MQTPQIDTGRLAEELVAARPTLGPDEQRIALALYRLLAEGAPVSRERLAQRAGAGAADVERFLDEQPGVYVDGAGCVVGFWGLALGAMPHRMTIGGREVYAWCAWDTLFLPELIGATATVSSTCPTTGDPVTLTVTPENVRNVAPAAVVLSFLRRETPFDADTIKTFCHFVHFFASAEAAERWSERHPGTFVLSLDQGLEIAREVNRAGFGPVLGEVA